MTWNYIAGFFDGEGSITQIRKGFRVVLYQANEEVLRAIKDFVGFGFIIEAKKREPHWKDSWIYYIAKQEEVLYFLVNVMPFLIVKKELSLKTIPHLKKFVKEQKLKRKLFEKRIRLISNLKKQGLTYRQIGMEIGIDYGHARKIFLRHTEWH